MNLIPTALAQPFTATASEKSTNLAAETGGQVQNLVTQIFQAIPYWVTGFIVIVLSLIIARIVKSAVENKMSEAGLEEEHREIQIVAGRSASAAVILIGITAGLKIAGLDLTSIIAAAAFGVGFAMKDLIMNFISGIIVLLQKQFTIGDWIKVNGTVGVIKEIQSRYTVIKKFDGTKVIVPNSELFKHQVTSFTGNPERRFTLNLDIDLYMDLKEVIDQIYKSIAKCDKILQHPKPSIIVKQPGAYANKLQICAWVLSKKGVLKPMSALTRQIHKDFYRKGWSWPYPTQTLILDKDVQPDVNARAKDYADKHKKVLKKKIAAISTAPVAMVQKMVDAAPPAFPAVQPAPQPTEVPQWLQQPAVAPAQPVAPAPVEAAPTRSLPIVTAPNVQDPQTATPTVAMPLPDVQK